MKSHLLTDSPPVKHLYSRPDKQDAPPHAFHTVGTHSQHHGRDAVSVVPRIVEGRVKQLSSPFKVEPEGHTPTYLSHSIHHPR